MPWPEFVSASTPSIQLHGLGGLARFRQDQLNRRQRILMTLAGPGASILGDRFLCHRYCPVSIWTSRELPPN